MVMTVKHGEQSAKNVQTSPSFEGMGGHNGMLGCCNTRLCAKKENCKISTLAKNPETAGSWQSL